MHQYNIPHTSVTIKQNGGTTFFDHATGEALTRSEAIARVAEDRNTTQKEAARILAQTRRGRGAR